MPFHEETIRRQGRETSRTGIHLEETIAFPTVEVVVMPLAGHFVSIGSPRQFHPVQPAMPFQGSDIPVDRSHARPGHMLLGNLEDLPRGEWSIGLREGLLDRLALPRMSQDSGPRSSSCKQDRQQIGRSCCEYDGRLRTDRSSVDHDPRKGGQ